MAQMYPRVKAGDAAISARLLNDMARFLERSNGTQPLASGFEILAKNDTGADLSEALNVVALIPEDAGVAPTVDAPGCCSAVAPDGEHPLAFIPACKAGETVRAITGGAFVVKVNMIAAGDAKAEAVADDTAKLASGTSGTFDIIAVASGTGEKLALVRYAGSGGASETGSSSNPFLLPAGTTDAAETTEWDITQDQNGYTGVEVEAWVRTYWGGGSGAVYHFTRHPTFDSTGKLVAIGPEIRTTLWSVGDCSTVVPAPVITGGSCLVTNQSTIVINWSAAPGGLPALYGYRYKYFRYGITSEWIETESTSALLTGIDKPSGSDWGNWYFTVQQGYGDGMYGPPSSAQITYDDVPPVTPVFVAGLYESTNVKRPVWSWKGEGSVSPGGGIIVNPPCIGISGLRGSNIYQVKLDTVLQGTYSYTLLTTPTWTPSVDLADGAHVLAVRERDTAGNWSEWAEWTITVDTTPPTAPTVSIAEGTVSPTNASIIYWSWTPGGGGNGNYRVSLTGTDGWIAKTGTLHGVTVTTSGTRTLYVQERDDAGNWSASGSAAIVVDKTPPYPVVMGTVESPTTNPRPTWTWSHNSGGSDGAGVYRHALDSTDLSGSAETTDTSWGPSSDLANGWHTLYVQERDALGNWSKLSGKSVLVTI